MAASGNSALRPQIGVTNVNSVIDTHDVDLTNSGVSLLPSTNATWTKFTSATEATVNTATQDAGYLLGKFEFAVGTQTSVRIPIFLTT